jgi:hypothetical protein
MKALLLYLILFCSIFSGYCANKVTVLVDYTMTRGRIDGLKKTHPQMFKEKTDIIVVYLGGGIKKLTSNKYEDFKLNCKFDECSEITSFLDNNNFNFTCSVNFPKSCSDLQKDYAIASIENLSKQEKKELKRSINTLLIDLKGVNTIENPLIELNTNNRVVDAGQEVEFIAKISNIKSIENSRLEWIFNGDKMKIIEIFDESKNFSFRTDLQSNTSVKCHLIINGCVYESSILNISVNECTFSIPYSLEFNAPLAFKTIEKYPNRHYISPLNNSDQSKVILIKQKCSFKEFEVEVSNMSGIVLNKEPYKIDEGKSRELLQFLSISDINIKAIDIKEAVENYPSQELYIKIIPKNLNIPYNNLPKYEVFFKDCQ